MNVGYTRSVLLNYEKRKHSFSNLPSRNPNALPDSQNEAIEKEQITDVTEFRRALVHFPRPTCIKEREMS